ncbi:MAG: carboxypeptidase-like regulatory domain-containing protein [Planctomycetota bacterium]
MRVLGAAGQPVAGARLAILPLPEGGLDEHVAPDTRQARERAEELGLRTALTDEAGRAEIGRLLPGVVRITVTAVGFAPLRVERAVPAPTRERRSVELRPLTLAPGHRLVGRVVDPRGAGVAGAELASVLDGAFGRQAEVELGSTDEEGRFALVDLAAGSLPLEIRATGFPVRREAVAVPRAEARELVIELAPGLPIAGALVVPPGYDPAGFTVVAYDQTAPMRNRYLGGSRAVLRHEPGIGFGGPWATCGPDGRFTIEGVPESAGGFALVVFARGDAELGTRWTAPRLARPGERDIVLTLAPPMVVELTLVNARTDEPITEGLSAWIGPLLGPFGQSDADVRVRADGSLVLSHPMLAEDEAPEDAEYAFTLTAPGFPSYGRRGLRSTPGSRTALGEVRLHPYATVPVRVVRAGSHEPLAGASLRLHTGPHEVASLRLALRAATQEALRAPNVFHAVTDADGSARIGCRAKVGGTLSATHPLAGAEEVEVAAGHPWNETIELALSPRAELRVLVLDPAGVPVPDVALLAGGYRKAWVEATSAVDGWAEFSLEPGRYKVAMGPLPSNAAPSMFLLDLVELSSGESHRAEVRIGALATVRGRVTVGESPLRGARVRVGEREVVTDEDGRYRVDGFPEGSTTVEVSHPERLEFASRTVAVRAPKAVCDFRLPEASILGLVTDSNGSPVAGADVQLAGVARARLLRYDSLVSRASGWTSDRDGRFELRGVTPGEVYSLRVRAAGFADAVIGGIRPDPASKVCPVEVVLGREAELRVLVEGATADDHVRVQMRPEADTQAVPRTLHATPGEELVVSDVAPGAWKVRVLPSLRLSKGSTDGDGYPAEQVELAEGDARTLTFRVDW